ncbi:MAG: DUF167 domain-containing protein [Zymomonas mobilis subsp. pomaceae]|uniref:UPF0235 protein Zymop_0454 n=1 Tax=Zymomonas mobilis subsp. pomaceae (strain ATCC 29192 / DSM 22645 / JCM 10191 / CCUG 17912 / NBRC 13757 / NCIMB 11200 / NRRL B-4491 / Barker I) TaxID=579138 RepID=F8EVF0_ZYMMT|nr:DUF167 domain-containing protein [Zymomonas mobilis]AEI37357.1 protein of unknown function DUF167 [Zymomonas mobilis subsp. pomaceae ATCC 29192]MDX5948725.1 DUF167 domain-containing protein [Zymomonas mobilis subsp. pomaceae]GEB88530.1 hypothetical protein ZMO02_01670 [Zymomonas mobilis subsp. pomaceae]
MTHSEMNTDALPYTPVADGIRIALRVTARASKTGFTQLDKDSSGRGLFRIRVAAPPVEGASNKNLMAYLSKQFSVSKTAVSIDSGEHSKIKIIHITGNAPELSQIADKVISKIS